MSLKRKLIDGLVSLLPQGAKEEWNPRTAVRLFSLEFEERWGPRHPTFFEGSYREALSRAKQEYKFLLVYLHSDSHPNTSTFCRYVSAHLIIADSTLMSYIAATCCVPTVFWRSSTATSSSGRCRWPTPPATR